MQSWGHLLTVLKQNNLEKQEKQEKQELLIHHIDNIMKIIML